MSLVFDVVNLHGPKKCTKFYESKTTRLNYYNFDMKFSENQPLIISGRKRDLTEKKKEFCVSTLQSFYKSYKLTQEF